MIKVITIVPGKNPDIDDAAGICQELFARGYISDFRPVMVMGTDSLEAIPVGSDSRKIAVDAFIAAGFEVIE